MNEARIRTCTRDPAQRLLFVGIALAFWNVWVGFIFNSPKTNGVPSRNCLLARFDSEKCSVGSIKSSDSLLGSDHSQDIELAYYEQLTAYG